MHLNRYGDWLTCFIFCSIFLPFCVILEQLFTLFVLMGWIFPCTFMIFLVCLGKTALYWMLYFRLPCVFIVLLFYLSIPCHGYHLCVGYLEFIGKIYLNSHSPILSIMFYWIQVLQSLLARNHLKQAIHSQLCFVFLFRFFHTNSSFLSKISRKMPLGLCLRE